MEEFRLEQPGPKEVKEQLRRLRLSFPRPERPIRKEKEDKCLARLKRKEQQAIKNGHLKYEKSGE